MTKFRYFIALIAGVCAPIAALAQSFFSGPLFYTPGFDFTTGFTNNATGYYLSQAYVPSPPQPTVGQGYYVRVRMEGIASPSVGRLMAVHFIPPSGTTILVDPVNAPVLCTYRAMSGTGNFVNFTNQPITDLSFGANLRIFGCPQPSAAGNPYPIVSVPGGTAFQISRRDPQNPAAQLWSLGSQAGYEFYIPVVSNRIMSGFLNADRAFAPIRSIQGDGLDPWTNPYVALLVSAAAGSPVSDMSVERQLPPPPPPSGRVGTSILCRNNGPAVAVNATCGASGVPSNANNVNVVCSPQIPVASLAVGGIISCGVIMDRFIGVGDIVGVASSGNADSNLANNSVTISISGGLTEVIMRTGFE